MINSIKCVCILLLLCGCTLPPASSNLFVDVPIQESIPISCKTCTLFLFPENNVYAYYSTNDIIKMKKSFMLLGDLIGKRNCALWYYEDNDKRRVSRSVSIIDTLNSLKSPYGKLKYKLGPTIVFLNFNPKMIATKNDNYYTAIEFNGEKADTVVRFMNDLTQLIRDESMGPGVLENNQLLIMCRNVIEKMHVQVKITLLNNFIEATIDNYN